MKMDGDLSVFKDAFCTPVEYFNSDLKDRAGQFFFMWDDEAFYAGLRTLDTKPANNSDDDHLWEGDAVEWYFDTRQNENFRSHEWGGPGGAGAVHCYWTGLKGTEVQGRFCLRPGYLDAIKKIGVEVAAKRTKNGMDVEFKLPWANSSPKLQARPKCRHRSGFRTLLQRRQRTRVSLVRFRQPALRSAAGQPLENSTHR